MATIRKTLAELKANPPRLSPEERARLAGMTDQEIEADARSDPDAPLWSDDQLERALFARSVRQARERLGLSQSQFADRFRINLSRLKDWEQGRFQPDSVALAYLTVIEREPEAVERALGAAGV
jgi:putative transcriptional regulator